MKFVKQLTADINNWLLAYSMSDNESRQTIVKITKPEFLFDVIEYLIDQDINAVHNKK